MQRFATLILTLTLGLTGAARANDPDVIEIGYIKWSGARFTTHVIQYILDEKMHHRTDLIMADPAAIYRAVAAGVIDFHTAAWLPQAHAKLLDRVAEKVIDAGPIYTHARLGWVVPDYIPERRLNSIADLKSRKVMEKLGGRIIGIDPGAGLTRLSRHAMEAYGLKEFGYNLVISSGPAMAAALKRAIEDRDWIVVTGRSPHWMFAAWDLRYLEDPKGVIGGRERVDILARKGFYQDAPDVYRMLDRVTIPLRDIRTGMRRAARTSYEEAARAYVERHPELVHYWVTGEMR